MDECQAEFSSKEAGSSLVETRTLIKSITDKKAFIKQATEVVLSQGRKLQDVLAQSRTLWPATVSGSDMRERSDTDDFKLLSIRKVQSTEARGLSFMKKAQSTENLTTDDPSLLSEILRSKSDLPQLGTSDVPRLRSSCSESSPSGESDMTKTQAPKQISLDSDRRSSWDVLDSRGGGSGGVRSPRASDGDRRNSWDVLDSSGGVRSPRASDLDRRSSWDVLDARGSPDHSMNSPYNGRRSPGSPKLLVTPRRAPRSVSRLKAATSVPALNINQNQQVVQNFMSQMDGRLNQLIMLWESRRNGLEEALKAMEFQESVPEILEWIDTEGAAFLRKFKHFGRSKEEVRDGG
jgi:hypothetical protein